LARGSIKEIATTRFPAARRLNHGRHAEHEPFTAQAFQPERHRHRLAESALEQQLRGDRPDRLVLGVLRNLVDGPDAHGDLGGSLSELVVALRPPTGVA
jgi:hypothetical protein